MAPQAQLEESANDLGSAGSGRRQKMDGFPYRNRCKSPFLSDFFLKSEPYVHRPARKVDQEKKRTDPDTEKIWPISRSAGTRFWTAKCQIPVAEPLKSGPQNDPRISLKNPTKGHLRLLLGRWHSPQVAPAAQKLGNVSFPTHPGSPKTVQ